MATEAQRARRRAQRATAVRVRNKTTILPRSFIKPSKEAQIQYANDVLNGREPYPAFGSREGNQLARMASFARHGRADPAFEAAFNQYWYHDEKMAEAAAEAEAEEMADYDEDEEEE